MSPVAVSPVAVSPVAVGPACPVQVPGPDGGASIAREPMWLAYAVGVDDPAVPGEAPAVDGRRGAAPARSTPAGPGVGLPVGTVDLLAAAPFPRGRVTAGDAEAHALVTAFATMRREPGSVHPDHRSYASARALFPVEAVLVRGGRAHRVDGGRRVLAALPAARPAGPPAVLLIGRYTAVPAGYAWYRGSLVHLELGIALRALAVALELFGVPGRLRLPGTGGVAVLRALGLHPTSEWSLPLAVETGPPVDGTPASPDPLPADPPPDDPVLADVVRVNRAQDARPDPVVLSGAVPDVPDVPGLSWAELHWRRTSGRMPRGLHGSGGRRCRVPASVLTSAAAWASVPPPGPLARIHAGLRLTAAVQDVDGRADGVHTVRAGEPVLRAARPGVPAELERLYTAGPARDVACDLRHASAIWFVTVRPRELVRRGGLGAWTAAQYVAGWVAHGLCLAAAAEGHYARPVRAFDELGVQRVLDLPADEMVLLAVVVGTPRPGAGPALDLRL